MPAPKAEALTQTELARRLDVDVRWIRTLRKRGMPFNADSERHPWPACLHWYVQFKEDAVRNEFRAPLNINDERARRERLLADKVEYELAQMRGDLFSGAYLRTQVQRLLEQLTTELRNFKGRWRHELVGRASARDVDAVLERAIEETIARVRDVAIASALPHEPGDDDGEEER